ncbi:MAG: flagellar brake protein [Azoarcus sp.]|jgi:c-di-GMP-binding flagellar brake protein YcgR|nr:flagellar brake protein [Azoarcus sp.]
MSDQDDDKDQNEKQNDAQHIAPIQEDELEEFLLHGRRQIRQLLQELIDTRALISIHLLPGGLSFLSTLLTLSDDEEWLFLDVSPNETIRRRALEAEHLLCVTQINKIRVQFRLERGTEVPLESSPAFAALIPGKILRLQRRDAYRLQVPLMHRLHCALPMLLEQDDAFSRMIEAPVVDISASGLSMEIPASKTASPSVGDRIGGCRLRLPGEIVIDIGLEIRNCGHRIHADGKEVLRLGCSFISLPTQAEKQIQRYIFQTEREIRSRA